MNEKRIEVKRPDWKTFFLIEAIWWSKRSPDAQTQCGCVIVGGDNTLLSAGYNGYIRAIHTDDLPNIRPDKYPYFIHSELNAILNACRNGKSLVDATIYITGKPCLHCLQSIYQAGIISVVYTDYSTPKMIEGYDEQFNNLVEIMSRGPTEFYIEFIPKEELEGYLQWKSDQSVTINLS